MESDWMVALIVGVPTIMGGYYFYRTVIWNGKAHDAKDARKQSKEMSEWVGFKVVRFLFTKRG